MLPNPCLNPSRPLLIERSAHVDSSEWVRLNRLFPFSPSHFGFHSLSGGPSQTGRLLPRLSSRVRHGSGRAQGMGEALHRLVPSESLQQLYALNACQAFAPKVPLPCCTPCFARPWPLLGLGSPVSIAFANPSLSGYIKPSSPSLAFFKHHRSFP